MGNFYGMYPCPYYNNIRGYNSNDMFNNYNSCQCPYFDNLPMYDSSSSEQLNEPYIPFSGEVEDDSRLDTSEPSGDDRLINLKDYGPQPFVVNINEATRQNTNFRTALWTGRHLQITLMSINVGGDIGLEIHPKVDQFICVEEGQGLVKMGNSKDALNFQRRVYNSFAIIVPAGTWHNVINTGDRPLKVYSIYAPPQHPFGTVHKTKADAEASEKARH